MNRRTFFTKITGLLVAVGIIKPDSQVAPLPPVEIGFCYDGQIPNITVHYVYPSAFCTTVSGQKYVRTDHPWAHVGTIHETVGQAVDVCQPGDFVTVFPDQIFPVYASHS